MRTLWQNFIRYLLAEQSKLDRIEQKLDLVLTREEHTMSALSDLQGAVARLNTSATAELKAIADKLAGLGDSVSATDVEAAVTAINAAAASLDAETAALTGTQPSA